MSDRPLDGQPINLMPLLPNNDLLPGETLLPNQGTGSVVDAIRPRLDDVERICGAYTRRDVQGYAPLPGERGPDEQYGRERGKFSAQTTPTEDQVKGFCDLAAREIAGRIGYAIPLDRVDLLGLAVTAGTWYACACVEAKRRPTSTDDAQSAYRSHLSNYTACLDRLTQLRPTGHLRLV